MKLFKKISRRIASWFTKGRYLILSLLSCLYCGFIRIIESLVELITAIPLQKALILSAFLICGFVDLFAQSDGGFAQATSIISGYQSQVKSLLNAIAAIIALITAFNIFQKMSNGDQDVKKTIMLGIGGCIAFVALAQALPYFFGVSS